MKQTMSETRDNKGSESVTYYIPRRCGMALIVTSGTRLLVWLYRQRWVDPCTCHSDTLHRSTEISRCAVYACQISQETYSVSSLVVLISLLTVPPSPPPIWSKLRSTDVSPTRGVDPYGTGGTCPPNILEVMLFRMSARVTATGVGCILMQILCVVSQKKLQLLGDFVPRPPLFLYVPPIILWDRRRWL